MAGISILFFVLGMGIGAAILGYWQFQDDMNVPCIYGCDEYEDG